MERFHITHESPQSCFSVGGDDLNLFAVKGTELTTCVNYLPDVLPERNDDWSCVSDLVFTLTVSAAQDPAHITVKFDDVYIVNQMLFEGYSPDTDAVSTSEASRENSPFCYQVTKFSLYTTS